MPLLLQQVNRSALTGGGERRLDFRPGSYWLHRSGLFGGELLQADASLLEHLLDGALLLEHSLHLVLEADDVEV